MACWPMVSTRPGNVPGLAQELKYQGKNIKAYKPSDTQILAIIIWELLHWLWSWTAALCVLAVVGWLITGFAAPAVFGRPLDKTGIRSNSVSITLKMCVIALNKTIWGAGKYVWDCEVWLLSQQLLVMDSGSYLRILHTCLIQKHFPKWQHS